MTELEPIDITTTTTGKTVYASAQRYCRLSGNPSDPFRWMKHYTRDGKEITDATQLTKDSRCKVCERFVFNVTHNAYRNCHEVKFMGDIGSLDKLTNGPGNGLKILDLDDIDSMACAPRNYHTNGKSVITARDGSVLKQLTLNNIYYVHPTSVTGKGVLSHGKNFLLMRVRVGTEGNIIINAAPMFLYIDYKGEEINLDIAPISRYQDLFKEWRSYCDMPRPDRVHTTWATAEYHEKSIQDELVVWLKKQPWVVKNEVLASFTGDFLDFFHLVHEHKPSKLKEFILLFRQRFRHAWNGEYVDDTSPFTDEERQRVYWFLFEKHLADTPWARDEWKNTHVNTEIVNEIRKAYPTEFSDLKSKLWTYVSYIQRWATRGETKERGTAAVTKNDNAGSATTVTKNVNTAAATTVTKNVNAGAGNPSVSTSFVVTDTSAPVPSSKLQETGLRTLNYAHTVSRSSVTPQQREEEAELTQLQSIVHKQNAEIFKLQEEVKRRQQVREKKKLYLKQIEQQKRKISELRAHLEEPDTEDEDEPPTKVARV